MFTDSTQKALKLVTAGWTVNEGAGRWQVSQVAVKLQSENELRQLTTVVKKSQTVHLLWSYKISLQTHKFLLHALYKKAANVRAS